jgi:molybdopterin synthase sulfur carrier subunit
MTTLAFTPNLARHVETPTARVEGDTLREALERYFEANPRVRGYVLDDQGRVRKHVAIFVNQALARDRVGLTDPIDERDEIFIAQALSGG